MQAFYVLYPWQGMEVLCEGAVIPYYEYRSPEILTGFAWRDLLDRPEAPPRPEWVQGLFDHE